MFACYYNDCSRNFYIIAYYEFSFFFLYALVNIMVCHFNNYKFTETYYK